MYIRIILYTLLYYNCDTSRCSLHCPCGSLTVQTPQPEPLQLPHGCQRQRGTGHSNHSVTWPGMPLNCGPQINCCRAAKKPHLLFSHRLVQTYFFYCIPVTPKLGDQLSHNVSKPIPRCSKEACPAVLERQHRIDKQVTSLARVACIIIHQHTPH